MSLPQLLFILTFNTINYYIIVKLTYIIYTLYYKYKMIISPKTGRKIIIGKLTYKKLLKEGYFPDITNNLLYNIMLHVDIKELSTLCNTNQFSLQLCHQVQFFNDYFKEADKNPLNDLGKEACIYKTKDMIIKITQNNNELPFYNLNSEGFVKLYHYFKLPSFPTIFNPCTNMNDGPVNIYILEWLPYDLSLPIFTLNDKYCLLFELLYTLKQAKRLYGFEHNDLHFDNIRFKSALPRQYTINNIVNCTSPYQCTLIDFGFATLTDKNLLLQHKDFVSFYNLVSYLMLPDKIVRSLSTYNSKKKGILFDTLLLSLSKLL